MKYSAVIIDDNIKALDALEKTVPWEKFEIGLVGRAYNGVEGANLIRETKPDIVISDIHMPEMDGLEMMELLENELTDSLVIFITAYEKIEYASRAIKLSAFDFLLKPLDNAELEKTLNRATAALDRKRSDEEHSDQILQFIRRTRFLAAANHGVSGDSDEAFLSFLSALPDGYCVIVAETPGGISNPSLQRLDYAEYPENTEVVTAVTDEELVVFCGLSGAEAVANWQSVARAVSTELLSTDAGRTIAVSNLHTSASELHAAYEEAMETLLKHNIYGRHTEVDFFNTPMLNQTKHTRVMDLEQCCSKLAAKGDELDAAAVWDAIYEKSEGHLRMIKIMLMFFCTKVMQDKMSSTHWRDSIDETTIYGLTKLKTASEAKTWLENFYKELQKVNVPASASLVRQVLEYIKSDVTGGLVLNDVAAHFYVSPNYLSALIRKETGITYRQHVINAKMAMAKQMLYDTRMRVEDIAYAIGYENYISFYNIFKKMENMSPTEYRFSVHNE